jgi:hypothetical protein
MTKRMRRCRGQMNREIREKYWIPLEGRHRTGAWEALDAGYTESHRAYHTWEHVGSLLEKLSEFSDLSTRSDIIAGLGPVDKNKAATPVMPVTPVLGVFPPRTKEARRSRSSCRIVAPVENAGRQDINALVCPVDFSHRLKAIARPQQHSRGEGRVCERVLHGTLRSWVQTRLPGNIDRLGSTLLSPSFTLP